ncbi:MAG: TRAP transporter substrate-binding protein [Propionivibrio sp.]
MNMKSFCKLTTRMLVMSVALAGAIGLAQAAPVRVSVSHTSSLQSPYQKGAVVMADTINKEAGDKFKVEVFGNGVLNQKNWRIMFEQTQAGANTIAIESVTALASIVPELGGINLPFLFQDIDHLNRFLQANPPILQKWKKKFEEKNLVVLAIAPRPFRQLINRTKLVKTPEDISGMKFRVPQNPMFVKIFEAMGAKPVPMSSGEIYSAIQLGTVVGEDNSVPVVYDFKTHEVAKYMTIWNYIGDASLVVINKDFWDKLSAEDQALFKKAAQEWVDVNVKEDASYSITARQNMEKAGVEFYDMDDAGKQAFAKRMEPVYADFEKTVGAEDWKAYQDAINAQKK